MFCEKSESATFRHGQFGVGNPDSYREEFGTLTGA